MTDDVKARLSKYGLEARACEDEPRLTELVSGDETYGPYSAYELEELAVLLDAITAPLERRIAELEAKTGRYRDAREIVIKEHTQTIETLARIDAENARLRNVCANFEVRDPDDDGDVWLILRGVGTTGKAAVNLGSKERFSAQIGLLLEEDRRAALQQGVRLDLADGSSVTFAGNGSPIKSMADGGVSVGEMDDATLQQKGQENE